MGSEASAPQHFFVLEEEGVRSRYEAQVYPVEPDNEGEAPRCPRCNDFIGMLTWLPPYRVELEMYGQELGDFIQGAGYEWLISERFAEAFRAEGLKGLEGFHPVEIVRVRRMGKGSLKPLTVPHYRVVSPCFGRAAVDHALNRMRISKPPTCSECRVTGVDAIHGIILDPGSWGREDIFRPRGLTGDLLVSERFKDFVGRHALTNMRLTPAEQYVWDPSNLGPAPLPSG